MKINLLIICAFVFTSCKSQNDLIDYVVYDVEYKKFIFNEFDLNSSKISFVDSLTLMGQNYYTQQNEYLNINNISKNYKQNQYLFKNKRLISKKSNSLNDFQSLTSNCENCFIADITENNEEKDKKFSILNDSSSSYIISVKENIIETLNFKETDIKIIYNKIEYTNIENNENNSKLVLLDTNEKFIKEIYSLNQINNDKEKGWLFGHYYFKTKDDCMILFYKFENKNIKTKILNYSLKTNNFLSVKEVDIPNEGMSVSNLLFDLLENGEIIITDNRNIYLIRKNNTITKLLTCSKNQEIIYIKQKI